MNIAMPLLDAGIPRIEDYKKLIQTSFFRDMETYSNTFLQENVFLQDHYKWVKDPLHQWSRQWEYLYVYRSVMEYLNARHTLHSPVKILDAGSGVTFFPYYLASTIRNLDITCCDSDGALAPLFDRVNQLARVEGEVKFVKADLHALPIKDDSIDVVYCISVLEHTRGYSRILDDFLRILRPGGCLMLTFDIGLDGVSEIAPESARVLLDEINRKFACVHDGRGIEVDAADSLTSRYVTQLDSRLAPWRFPRLSLIKAALRAKRMPTSLGKILTVYCNAFIKPAP
jgi:ubiquinone/menaquinone biosynthesis C-methylase UbiE